MKTTRHTFVPAGFVISTAVVLAGCASPSKVVIDQPGGVVEVQDGASGATRVKIRRVPEPAQAESSAPVQVGDKPAQIDAAYSKLSDLQAKVGAVREEMAAALKEREQAVEARVKAAADVDQARRAAVALNQQIEQLRSDKVALERQLAELTNLQDKTRREVGQNQGRVHGLAAEIERLSTAKVAMERELSAITLKAGKAEDALASASSGVAAREKRLEQLKEQQAESETAVTVARMERDRVTADAAKAAANLGQLRSQIETKKRELASFAAPAKETGGNGTSPVAVAAEASTSSVDSTGGAHRASAVVRIVGGVVAVVLVAAGAVMYLTRKPRMYTFALLDETSKASHRIQMSSGERIDLNGALPMKKLGSGNGRVPFLTIDRKGRLGLHPATGFSTKLNDRLISTTDIPTVKPGNVIEVAANGQVSRLVVGPVSAANQNQKLPAKLPTASVRPGVTTTA